MSNESSGYSMLDQYRNISNKLKRKFLRKPNESEAAESFVALSQQCESQNLPQYAALSWIAAARCEGTLGNNVNETSNLIRAARQFLETDRENHEIGTSTVSTEYLEASLACYCHASTRYPEESSIPLALNLEIVDSLKKIGYNENIKSILDNAVDLSKDKPQIHIRCLKLLADYFMNFGDYISALRTIEKINNLLDNINNTDNDGDLITEEENGDHCDILLQCEINSVFLLLILKATPQNLAPNLAKILEKYTWGDQNDLTLLRCKMSTKLFILMQSLVTSCQSVDSSNIIDLESEFWSYISTEQKDLLRELIRSYCT